MQNDTHTNPFIKAAFDSLGGSSSVARLFDVTPWAAAKWLLRLPEARVLPLAKATDYAITPHQLMPELYPNEWDGLPAERAVVLLRNSIDSPSP